VRNLVDDRVREVQRIESQRGRQQWIVEPPERAERSRRAKIRVEAPRLKVAGGFVRGAEVEEPLVGDSADDWKPPGVRLETIAISSGQDEHQGVPPEATIRGKALPNVQADGIAREGAGGQHQLQFRSRGFVGLGILEQAGNLLATGEDSGLLPSCAAQVTPSRREREEQQHADREARQHAPNGSPRAGPDRRHRLRR
jgi:hypothetical protein